jgi:hypothetical protein
VNVQSRDVTDAALVVALYQHLLRKSRHCCREVGWYLAIPWWRDYTVRIAAISKDRGSTMTTLSPETK